MSQEFSEVPLVDNVRFFEKRIMTYDPPQPDRFITSEKKNVLVDSYIKWRIIDPSNIMFQSMVMRDRLKEGCHKR